MVKKDYKLILKENIKQLNLAKKHLEASFSRCQTLNIKKPKSEDDIIQFEALTSRFTRAADMLIHKVYRSIDAVELIEGGTLIDVINRAEKRNVIDSAITMRTIKDLRNDIAHEYIAECLRLLHEEVFSYVPILIDCINKATDYSQRYL